MKTIATLIAGASLALAFASDASAKTVSGVSGNVCEGGVAPAVGAPCPASFNLGDFNGRVGNPVLEIVGDTRIWGGVAHRTQTKYTDAWTMDFGTDSYAGTFNWQPTSADFDATLFVNGNPFAFSTADFASGGGFSIGTLTGTVAFILDPRAGDFPFNPDEVATWDLEVSQVPLPAGVVLLLTGLGGLAIAKRRSRA